LPKKINTVITFDDGYKSWVTSAVPILRKLKLPATFFISSDFVGKPVEHERQFGKSRLGVGLRTSEMTGCLEREDVRRIAEYGFTVGGHTKSHSRLSDLQSEARVREEIVMDKKSLEQITAHEVKYFAYPYGAIDNSKVNLAKILREAGYRGAVTTISDFNTSSTDPYKLHRELTRASMSSWVFRAKVYGNTDALRHLWRFSIKIRGRD